jgi:prepilin-type N-terminal cleavage/methylation domain-containing protein
MCQDKKLKTAPLTGFLAVDWHDCAWVPAIIVRPPPDGRRLTNQLPATLPFLHTGRRRSIPLKTMKMSSLSARRPRAGFTLIELLVVIAIIGILAAMLLAVLPGVMNSGKKTKAKLEAQAIATAIEQYDSAYGRFPISSGVQTVAATGPTGDFTYGGSVISNYLSQFPSQAAYSIYTTNNSEVIAILMNLTNYPNVLLGATANVGYQKNPQKTIFLNAKMSGWDPSQLGTPQPGVGNDLVYRDPWGNPYIITMDLNYDDVCNDALYGLKAVSQQNGQTGYNGLVNTTDPGGNGNNFQYHGKVMVWSAGQDGKIDPVENVNDWENKNNVLSW